MRPSSQESMSTARSEMKSPREEMEAKLLLPYLICLYGSPMIFLTFVQRYLTKKLKRKINTRKTRKWDITKRPHTYFFQIFHKTFESTLIWDFRQIQSQHHIRIAIWRARLSFSLPGLRNFILCAYNVPFSRVFFYFQNRSEQSFNRLLLFVWSRPDTPGQRPGRWHPWRGGRSPQTTHPRASPCSCCRKWERAKGGAEGSRSWRTRLPHK